MSGITIVDSEEEFEQRLLGLLGSREPIRRTWSVEWRDPREAVQEICAADPSLVIFHDLLNDDALALASEVDRRYPNIEVLVITADQKPEEIVELLRGGAKDVLGTDASDNDIESRIRHLLGLVSERRASLHTSQGIQRRVVVVVSPKGGTGKTTLSTNVAAGAARRYPNRVLLVDLDSQFGDVASSLGLDPEYSIHDAAAIGAAERTALKVFLTLHETGLAVLAAPTSLTDAEDLNGDSIKRTLAAFIEEFPLTLVDTAAGIDEEALVAMEFATDLAFVATPEVPAIRAIKKQLDALDTIGMTAPRRHLLLNRSDAKVGISANEIEETLGMEIRFQIPSTRQMPIAANEGIPLILRDRDKATRPLQDVVDYFAPAHSDQSRSTWWPRRKEA